MWSASTAPPSAWASPTPPDDEEALRAFLRDFSKRATAVGLAPGRQGAAREGWRVNNKRVQRLWRDEGLKVPYRKRKKPLRGIGTAVGAMCPIAPNALWALDFQFDTTEDNRTLKLLNIVDEFTRECPAIVVERSIDADQVVATLDRLVVERGAPAFVRFDNGPEFIAYAVADWCRFNGVGSIFIDPGSPWQNAWIESFNGRLATSSSTAGASTACSRPRCSSRTGGSTRLSSDGLEPNCWGQSWDRSHLNQSPKSRSPVRSSRAQPRHAPFRTCVFRHLGSRDGAPRRRRPFELLLIRDSCQPRCGRLGRPPFAV